MNVYEQQIVELILRDSEGQPLVVTSALQRHADGTMTFTVGEDSPHGARYLVSLRISEIPNILRSPA